MIQNEYLPAFFVKMCKTLHKVTFLWPVKLNIYVIFKYFPLSLMFVVFWWAKHVVNYAFNPIYYRFEVNKLSIWHVLLYFFLLLLALSVGHIQSIRNIVKFLYGLVWKQLRGTIYKDIWINLSFSKFDWCQVTLEQL